MVKIDDDVPMPLTKQDILDTYPIATLEPGQSFFAPADTKLADKLATVARQYGAKQKPVRTYVTERRTEYVEALEADSQGVRLWRKT